MDKTLKKLREYIESGQYNYTAPMIGKEEVKMCIEALEKEVPKKLIKYANGTEHCPCCELDNTRLRFNVCVDCGQKLDWSE